MTLVSRGQDHMEAHQTYKSGQPMAHLAGLIAPRAASSAPE